MDNATSVTTQIERSLERTGRIAAGIASAQSSASTPCPEWSVRDVPNHTVGGVRTFVGELTGDRRAAHEADWPGDDPIGGFEPAAAADRAALLRSDALAGPVTISLGNPSWTMADVVHLTEMPVHKLDLVVDIDQVEAIGQRLCRELLSIMEAIGGVAGFGTPTVFGSRIATDHAAPAHRRLAASLARDLHLTAGAGTGR